MNRPLRVIGLDLSLTSTGLSDGQSVHVIQTYPGEPLEARLDRLVRGVVSFALSPTQWTDRHPQGMLADLAVIEAGAFSRGAQSGAAEILSALRIMVRHRLWRLDVPFAMVAPTTLKLYAAGSGKATKREMAAALYGRHGLDLQPVKVKDGRYDMADAFALAAMGRDRVGQPIGWIGSVPQQAHGGILPVTRSSLDAVVWPDLVND